MSYDVDYKKFKVDAEGVKGLHFPVSLREMHDFRDLLLPALAAEVRSAVSTGTPGANELKVLATNLAIQCMNFFWAQKLVSEGTKGDDRISPKGYRVWSALAEKSVPELPANCRVFEMPLPVREHGSLWRKIHGKKNKTFSSRRSLCKSEEVVFYLEAAARESLRINSKPFFKSVQDGIIATRRAPIMSQHAAQVDESVWLVNHKYWFKNLSSVDVNRQLEKSSYGVLIKRVLDLVADVFARSGVEFSLIGEQYIGSYMRCCLGPIACHLERLMLRPKKLPRHLWIGSAGQVLDRMLGIAVKENGGQVTGHSHGTGLGLFRASYGSFYEFTSCDTYVVKNGTQVQQEYLVLDPAYSLDESTASLVAIEDNPTPILPTVQPQAMRNRRILYVDAGIEGGELHLAPGMPEIVLSDWQARLFSHLRTMGYEVTHKPHPQLSFSDFPKESWVGTPIDHRPFEKVLNDYDILLYDWPTTTTFGNGLRSLKPIVFVDFRSEQWLPDALRLVRSRIGIVSGWFDEDNRARVEWSHMQDALEKSLDLAKDTTFAATYLI